MKYMLIVTKMCPKRIRPNFGDADVTVRKGKISNGKNRSDVYCSWHVARGTVGADLHVIACWRSNDNSVN